MPLRMHSDGARVLDEWLKYRSPPTGDQKIVAEVLRTVADMRWQSRWDNHTDLADSTITILEPRPGLTVHVRLWDGDDPDQFILVRIIDEAPPDEDN